jgi:hypothetical protein
MKKDLICKVILRQSAAVSHHIHLRLAVLNNASIAATATEIDTSKHGEVECKMTIYGGEEPDQYANIQHLMMCVCALQRIVGRIAHTCEGQGETGGWAPWRECPRRL